MSDFQTPPGTKCRTCDKPIHDEDAAIRSKFDVPDLGESGYFYFCSTACLMPWVTKTRQNMINFNEGR